MVHRILWPPLNGLSKSMNGGSFLGRLIQFQNDRSTLPYINSLISLNIPLQEVFHDYETQV